MFKTCISITTIGKAPEILKKFIDEAGWPICTIIIKPGRVSIYFYYKWYDYYYVRKAKKVVEDYEEQTKYYCRPDIYGDFLSEAEMQYVRADEEATERFIHDNVRRMPKDSNVEAIVDDNGCPIGCKISLYNCLRRGSK